MKIILKQDIGKIGSLGDQVTVKPGYARNYLIPRGFAIQVTKENEKFIRQQREYLEKKRTEAIAHNKSLAEKLKDLSLKFVMPAGKNGKLFGSVTAKMIAEEIGNTGIEVDTKNFHIGTTIKQLGLHKVPVKLHSQVAVTINVQVVSNAQKSEPAAAPEKPSEVTPDEVPAEDTPEQAAG